VASPLERAVEVMDRLRSPGGCPWDAAQTHGSLARYLLEETYEVLEAIETGDLALLREELGDLLLQVLFHARLTEELPAGRAFGIDEVAGDLVDKLIRRHPHVFAGADAGTADQLNETWERQKVAEKGRTSVVDGVPLNQPALALAGKLVSRAARAGLSPELQSLSVAGADAEAEIGARLLAVVTDAVMVNVDAETALRRAVRAYRQALVAAEQAADGH
jgi:XTP/dITP diphosphohydrolase